MSAKPRTVLDHAAPAALGAMVATELTRDGREGSPGMTLLAAGVCGLVAWRTGRIGLTVLAGIASVWLGRLVWGA